MDLLRRLTDEEIQQIQSVRIDQLTLRKVTGEMALPYVGLMDALLDGRITGETEIVLRTAFGLPALAARSQDRYQNQLLALLERIDRRMEEYLTAKIPKQETSRPTNRKT